MGGGTFNPEKPVFPGQPYDVDSLRRELAGLAGIAEAYAEIKKRLDHEVEMREWAEREEEIARREAEDARHQLDQARLAEHTRQRIADYRQRAQGAERELDATQRVRDSWRETSIELDLAICEFASGEIDVHELSHRRVDLMEELREKGLL